MKVKLYKSLLKSNTYRFKCPEVQTQKQFYHVLIFFFLLEEFTVKTLFQNDRNILVKYVLKIQIPSAD